MIVTRIGIKISRRNSTGNCRATSFYPPFFPLSLKVSIKPAAWRPTGKMERNGGKAATSCFTLGGYGIWGKRTSWFPRPTFHRDLASSAARSRSTSSSHPPTRSPQQFFTPPDRFLHSRLLSREIHDRIDATGTRPWIPSRREGSISSGNRFFERGGYRPSIHSDIIRSPSASAFWHLAA